MATTDHKGSYSVGTIVGYTSYSGTVYGYKLLKEVYLSETAKYHWIAQPGKVKDNKFVPTNQDLTIQSEKEINDGYPLRWTADPEFKKGDILIGKDKGSGKTLLFVYISDSHVERLTPRPDLYGSDQFGYSTLTDYAGNFGPLSVHQTQKAVGFDGKKKFSSL